MSAARTAGAIAGGLVAGLGITALLMAGERRSGKPSELAALERRSARRIGLDTARDDRLPDAREQVLIQGGHLMLSAAAGTVFAAAVDKDAGVVPSGIAFGLAFYGAMHWVTGPLLGVTQPEWRADAGTIGMHALNHLAFGVATAGGARLADRLSHRDDDGRTTA